MYTEEAFSRLADKLSTASPTGQDVRAFSRLFYSQVQRVELDSQGRVRVPPELVDLAGLQKEAVLVGAGEHLELWDTRRWKDYVTARQAHYDDIAERAFAAGSPGDRKT
jgi:MraZ protein